MLATLPSPPPQHYPTPTPQKDFGSAIFLSCFTCGMFFICPEVFMRIFPSDFDTSTKKWKNQTTRILKKKKNWLRVRESRPWGVRIQSLSCAESSFLKLPDWYDNVLESEPARNIWISLCWLC